MIEGVLDLADSPVRTIMTPRPRVQWLDLNSPKEHILSRVRSCPHAQLLVCRGSIDEVVGIVRKQDLIDQVLDGRSADVEQVTRQVRGALRITPSAPHAKSLRDGLYTALMSTRRIPSRIHMRRCAHGRRRSNDPRTVALSEHSLPTR
jgi:CBS domain containing-hemolysin-like protein